MTLSLQVSAETVDSFSAEPCARQQVDNTSCHIISYPVLKAESVDVPKFQGIKARRKGDLL